MLATAIFALVVVALAVGLGKTIDAGIAIRQENEIRLKLQSLLAETRQKHLEPGREIFEKDSHGVTYEQEVAQVTLKNDKKINLRFYQLTVRARWETAGQTEKREANILIYQP